MYNVQLENYNLRSKGLADIFWMPQVVSYSGEMHYF